jgi:hypothetical protein
VEPEASSSRLKEPGTCPSPEPDQSSTHYPIRLLLKSVLLVCSHQSLRLPSGLFLWGCPTSLYMHLTCHPYMPHQIHYFSFDKPDTIWWGVSWCSLLCSFHSPLYSCTSYVSIFLSTIFTDAFSLHSSLTVRGEGSQQNRTSGKINVTFWHMVVCVQHLGQCFNNKSGS